MLNEVAQISESYAKKLHDPGGLKPFSVSPLILGAKEEWQLTDGSLNIKENARAKITISAFDEATLGVFMKAFIDAQKQQKLVNIGGLKAGLEDVHMKETEGARFDTYHDLIKKAKKKRKLTFKILTPMSFRQNGIQTTFPTAELVFSSLLQTWNAFSDVKLSEELKDKFKLVGVSRFNLHSELWHFSNYKIFGARGSIEYTFSKDFKEEELKMLNALSRFATYTGVGYKRTMGMGMVNVEFE
ncbi:MAG: CRISPR-associated endoribonuclease Cas6 [Thermodesulfovibrio sp.]